MFVNEKLGEAIYGENSAKIITEAINSKDLVTARRTGRISGSSNPIAKVLGVKIKQGKTNTEALMAVLGKNDWQLDPRSNQKELDTAYSELMGPYLDKQAHLLLSSKKFMSKNENDKRAVLSVITGSAGVPARLRSNLRTNEQTLSSCFEKQNKR